MAFVTISCPLNSSNITISNNNGTQEDPYDCWSNPYTPIMARIIVAVILSFMIVADLFGNVLVILAYATYPKLKTTTNCFICGLAIADILVACFGMPFWLYYTADPSIMIIPWVPLLYKCFDIVVSVSSIGHLMFIGIDRYYAVTSPINHRMRMTSTKVKILIGTIWVFSILTSLISLIKDEFQHNDMVIMIVGFAVPLLVLLFCYTHILYIAISRLRKQKNRDKHLQKELRSARTVGVVTGTFFICWLPFNIVSQYFIYCAEECYLPLCPFYFYILVSSVKLLHYFNSCVNPAIYAYFSRSYRQAFQGLFVRHCKARYSSRERIDVENSSDDQDLLTRVSRMSRRVRKSLGGKPQNPRNARLRQETTMALSMYESERTNPSTEDSPITEQQTSFTSIKY